MRRYIRFTSQGALALVAATSLCFAGAVHAQDTDKSSSTGKSKLSMNDKKFLKKAYRGGLTEVEGGKMAKDKAKNDATKDVADRMVTDHSKANDDIMNIAKEENLDLSGIKAKPQSITGDNFDKEYLTMLKKDHEKDIAEFEKEANDSGSKEDNDVKEFAKKTLPTLKEHLQMVNDALAKVQ